MYTFAIVALLGLATLKLVDYLVDAASVLQPLRGLLIFVAAVGGVWILDYSLFAGFHTVVRNHAVGVWITGFMVAGLTVPWRAVFSYLTHDRADRDETLGDHRPLRKVS